LTSGDNDVILGTAGGWAARFHESAFRDIGSNTRGVRGIRFRGDDKVVSMIIANDQNEILTVTENGYGKRTSVSDYRKTARGGKGTINVKFKGKKGTRVVALKRVQGDGQDVMLITRNGIIIRLDVATIRKVSRYSEGVRLINLNEGDSVIDIAICDSVVESDETVIVAPPSEIPIQAPVETMPEDVEANANDVDDEDDEADDVNDDVDDDIDGDGDEEVK